MTVLHSASVHYWRIPVASWERVLDRLSAAGLSGVDIYIPWSEHEGEPGQYDFGEKNEALDVGRFLDLVDERGLWAILRPGPAINAEMNNFGLPQRIVRDTQVQALTSRGRPVFCPSPPVMFPAPSFASEKFLDETGDWFAAVGEAISHHAREGGPVRMVQVDNEASLFFRDAPFDQDYRPEAIDLYKEWLTDQGLQPRDPPVRREPGLPGLAAVTGWVRFRQWMILRALERMRDDLQKAGLGHHPFSHNMPPSGIWAPVRPGRLAEVVDVVTTDVYASARETTNVEDQALMLSSSQTPTFAAEMNCGTVFFAPRIGPFDNRFVTLVAMAHGIKGYNLYMGAGRDRWIGGLIPEGRSDEGSDLLHFFQRLIRLMGTLREEELGLVSRAVLVAPDGYADHSVASFPLPGASPTLLAALSIPVCESLVDDTWDLEDAVQVRWLENFREIGDELTAAGVAYTIADGRRPFDEDAVVFVPTYGYLDKDVIATLLDHAEAGGVVLAGPRDPSMDANLQPLDPGLIDRWQRAKDAGNLIVAETPDAPVIRENIDKLRARLGTEVPWEIAIRAPSVRILPHKVPDGDLWVSWCICHGNTAGQRCVLKARPGWSWNHVLAVREGRAGAEFVNGTGTGREELTLDVTGRQIHIVTWRRNDVQ